MRAPAKLAAYAAVLAVALGGGAGAGAALGPIDVSSGDDGHPAGEAPGDDEGHGTTGTDDHGRDATAAGDARGPSHRAVVDGYEVSLDGHVAPGGSELRFTVTHEGEAVPTEPYLGAAGHLVAVRDDDTALADVHPLGDDDLRFAADFPTPGTYRLFLDFAHGGEVRTAAFTVEVPGSGAAHDPAPPASPTTTGHDDGGR